MLSAYSKKAILDCLRYDINEDQTHKPLIWIALLFNPSLSEHDMPCLSSVDPDQFASEEANWSGSALFVI